MSGPDAMHGEMPGFFPGRPGGEHDEPLLDMIFDRRPLPPGAPPEMHDLERRLAALAGSAEPGELAGEAAALAAFTRLASPAGISPAARRPARHRLSRRPARGRLALAAALVAAAAGLGGATAAYNDMLPGPIQQMAHVTVGAPAPRHGSPHSPGRSGTRSGAHQTPGSPAPQASSSAPRAAASGQPILSDPHYRPLRHGPRPAGTCTPRSYLAQNPPGQGSGVPSWAPPSPGADRCLGIPIPTARGAANPTAVPGQGQ
jgi:hypothetical protein